MPLTSRGYNEKKISDGAKKKRIYRHQQIKPAITLRGISLNDMESYFRWSRLKLC
jgi:hypothetical protein